MNQSMRFAALVTLLLVGGAMVMASPAGATERGRYIVVFEDSVEHPASLARVQTEQRNGGLGFVYRHALKGYAALLPESAIQGLRNNPRVAFVEPDVRGGVASQTTPTGIDRVFAPTNEALHIDGEDGMRLDVDVAVIDTGVDDAHPDLNVAFKVKCIEEEETEAYPECVEEQGDDGSGHGTHVAGTIAALDNGEGVVGVAPGARIWSIKVLTDGGWGALSWYVAGVDWVTGTREDEDPGNDIEVANASLRYFTASSEAAKKALKASVEAGVVHVAAAGNESQKVKFPPGNDPSVITVSALGDSDGEPGGEGPEECYDDFAGKARPVTDDALASFSNYGSDVEVAAPGVCILSTYPGGEYKTASGTSMASPHVAGAAAILAALDNPEGLGDVEAIRDTIVEEGNFGWEDTSGDGIEEPLLDVSNEEVFKAPRQPVFAFAFGEAGTGNGQFDVVEGLAVDSSDGVWVADRDNDRIQHFNSAGEYLGQFGKSGSGNGQLDGPTSITVGSGGDLWVAEYNNHRIQHFNAKGEYLGQFGKFGTGNGQFNRPNDVAIDSKGDLWVVDHLNHRIQHFNAAGEYLGQFGKSGSGNGQLSYPSDIAIDSDDGIWVTDSENNRVQHFSAGGEYLGQFGESGNGNGQFEFPEGIAVDSNDGIWVVDQLNHRVQHFGASGAYLGQFGEYGGGDGQFAFPADIALDSSENVWVSDIGNTRIEKWSQGAPIVMTEAATGLKATQATLNATVNPLGTETTYQFEYGATTAYGSKAPAEPKSIGSKGTEAVGVSRVAHGLEPHTTYHFRVVAQSSEGTTYGEDRTFTTQLFRAPRFRAETYPATLAGGQDPEQEHAVALAAGSLGCEAVDLEGELTQASAEMAMSAAYAGCELTTFSSGTFPASVDMNSCHYVLHVADDSPPYGGSMDIACGEEGDGIQVSVYKDETEESLRCRYRIGPQEGLEGLAYGNLGEGSEAALEAGFELSSILATREVGTFLQCGAINSTANYDGASVLGGSDEEEAPVGVYVSGESQGLYLTGGESEEEQEQPHLNAETYPVVIAGGQDPEQQHAVKLWRTAKCDEVYFDGEAEAATTELAVDAEYVDCSDPSTSKPVSVDMNSCRYVLHLANAGPPYSGSLDLACDEEGDGVELTFYSDATKEAVTCRYWIGPQEGLEDVSYANLGEGSEAAVEVGLNLTEVAYTRKVGTLLPCGLSKSQAAYSGASVLYGF